jgi:hypothetical protein
MNPHRLSGAERRNLAEAAQLEIMRYKDNHYLWHLHVHGVKLDAMQIIKCEEMDANNYTIDTSCRRTGKTAVKALWQLKFLACNGDQELGCVAPRLDQAKTNITYMTDAIARSEILTNFVLYKNGRKQLSDESFQFYNRSKARAYGIMSQVDGGDLTMADLEEVDDMPKDRLYSNFLLMLTGTRRLGADINAKNDPMIRVTGVFKGSDTLESMIDSGEYHMLPLVDIHLGIAMGILQPEFARKMQKELPQEEYIRQLLCERIVGSGFIRFRKWRAAVAAGIEGKLNRAKPLPGGRYRKRGNLVLGMDAAGHGERPEASKWVITIGEQLGNFICPIYVKYWSSTADEGQVINDIAAIWEYFRPDYGMGDAFGVAVIAAVNDLLYDRNIISINRHEYGESSASTWPNWAFSPVQFQGATKHQMATTARTLIHTGRFALPYIPEIEIKNGEDLATEELEDWQRFHHQVNNITAKAVSGLTFLTYKMTDTKIGDDGFDALIAMVAGFGRLLGTDNTPQILIAGGNRAAGAHSPHDLQRESGDHLEKLGYSHGLDQLVY